MRAPVLPGRRWIVHASACCITGLALSSGVFSACHPTADALVNYRAYPATFERDVRTGRYEVYAREGLRLRQQRAGNRCVTQPVYRDESVSSVHDALVHDCASPVVLYGYPWGTSLRRGLFERPVYRELVFASVEGQVICNKTAARYLLFTAPLWEWIVSAIAGVLLGLWTLSVTRRTIATWRALSVRRANANGGLARCEDGTTVAFAGVLYGPVVVPGDPEPGAPFRDASLRATYVFAGSVEEWERALTACESVATSFALAVVWLPASPLLAAPFLGMLTPL